jgi:hypothetical protein
MEPSQTSRLDMLQGLGKSMGPCPGVEIPLTPDEPGDPTMVMVWIGQ